LTQTIYSDAHKEADRIKSKNYEVPLSDAFADPFTVVTEPLAAQVTSFAVMH